MKTLQFILNETETSYSFDRYTTEGWKDCIEYLLRAGLAPEEVIKFMLSKHMRWAGDCDESGLQYGELNLNTLKNYLSKYPQYGTSTYINSKL